VLLLEAVPSPGLESSELREIMSLGLIHYSCVSMILVKGLVLDIKTDDRNAQVIQMTAKKYEFSPAQVHVKLGMKVQLKITAIDRDHGITIVPYPVGDGAFSPPGLAFTSTAGSDGWRLKKHKETMIEFVARSPGTYNFNCSLLCGLHHGRMKGQLIVGP
jgi:heme/copper-type cytochrome/quinol oxidase subunit 2